MSPDFDRLPDEEQAPVDYSYVPSVSEGRRLEQAQKIHREAAPSGPIVRHRAEPDAHGTLVGYGQPAPQGTPLRGRDSVQSRLPSASEGPAPAQSIAYPEDYGIPDNPFEPSPESQQPRRRRAAQPSAPAAPAQPPMKPAERTLPANATSVQAPGTGARTAVPVMTTADGSQFEAPGKADVPDWLRVAQQNNLPMNRPQAPRVHAAPRQEEEPQPVATDALGRPLRNRHNIAAAQARRAPQTVSAQYEEAGYPAQLLSAQRQLEAEAAAMPVRRRHGAQYAVMPTFEPEETPLQPVQQRASYPPPRSVYARTNTPPPPTEKPSFAPVQPPEDAPVYRRRAEAVSSAEEGMQRGYRRPAYAEPETSPYQVETDEPDPSAAPRFNTLWLGAAAFAAVLAAIVLWILQSTYAAQTQQVLDDRAAQQQAIAEAHPLQYASLIDEKAAKYNLHPAFVAAIMLNESSFRPDATSRVDARGLMQLMDDTAQWIYGKMDLTGGYDFDDLYDPQINAEYGCWYLNYLSGLFYGDPVLVAAAFHAGQGEVRNWLNDSSYSADGRSIPLEDMIDGPTKQYVTRVLNDFAAYKRLYYGG